MIEDNTTWIFQFLRNRNAFFAKVIMGGKVHLIAGNRAARRFLNSGKIQRLSKTNGATIDVDSIS